MFGIEAARRSFIVKYRLCYLEFEETKILYVVLGVG
jgi:hypothetical protein